MSPSTAPMTGADAVALDAGAEVLRLAAAELDAEAAALTASLVAIAWLGDGADDVRDRWRRVHRRRLTGAAASLRHAADALDTNAGEQRDASRALGGATAPATRSDDDGHRADADRDTGGGVDATVDAPPWLDRLGGLLATIGVDAGAAEALREHLDGFPGGDAIERIVDLLADPRVRDLLAAAGNLADVGGLVVDVVTDLAEHPELAVDERIVHALADGGINFAMSEGTEWLVSTLTVVALSSIPGAAPFTPVVREAVLLVAEPIVEEALDRLDEATDFVDRGADLVVDAYRALEEQLAPAIEAARIAGEVVGSATDLIGDGADWTVGRARDGYEWLDDHIDDLRSGAGDLVSDLRDDAARTATAVVDGADALTGAVADGAAVLADGLGSLVP